MKESDHEVKNKAIKMMKYSEKEEQIILAYAEQAGVNEREIKERIQNKEIPLHIIEESLAQINEPRP